MAVGIMAGALFLIGSNVFADHSSFNSGLSNYFDSGIRDASCVVGGCGASSCTFAESATIWMFGMTVQVSITCQKGYHACCGANSGSCLPPASCSEYIESNGT